MKAIQLENGTIKTYNFTPKNWGNVIGGFNLLSDSDIQSYGFYDVVIPSYNSNIKELGDLEWDSENNVFTYPINNKTFSQTLSEIKAEKIIELKGIYNSKIGNTDWVIIRAQEGTTAPQSILDERASLRIECATHESSINNLTTKAQVADYLLPNHF